jgi:preprotein translocase subunit SecA
LGLISRHRATGGLPGIAALTLPPTVVYPEREDRQENWLDRLGTMVTGIPALVSPGLRAARLARIVRSVGRHRAEFAALDDDALQDRATELRVELRRAGFAEATVARCFALIREVAERTTGLRHFDVQLLGGFAMLKGMVAEMETGEGKTLTATLPACAAALAGIPVHIVTVNDYLAERDARTMGPVYRALGLSVATVVHGMSPEQRRAAYLADVTYCTNKEVAFDYLRDRMVLGQECGNLRLKLERLYGDTARSTRLVMRGLHYAIVDEADSILIDEARTPLIISGETDPGDEQRKAEQALELVETLEPDRDYRVLLDERSIELTEAGKARLVELAEAGDGVWHGRIRREEAARQALSAKLLFQRDEHYLVRDGKVQIIDEYTGRIMEDRSWSEGLHQLMEVKEGCPATGQKVPLARMTYQRFFRRYRRLAGMTGTAREVVGELWSVYRLPVAAVPTNRPLRRVIGRDRIYPTADGKWRAIAARVAELHGRGRPVLLGTRSVAASESASHYLSEAGLEHVVLNAAQDQHEAEIVARAGQRGRITIATNMAGRGVDIKLEPEVAEHGGLHVIMSERHDAGRIDRQLTGRCGRQGEPGAAEAVLSLEDPLLEQFAAGPLRRLARTPGPLGGWAGHLTFGLAQGKAERVYSRMRRDLVKYDRKLGNLLSFSGRME